MTITLLASFLCCVGVSVRQTLQDGRVVSVARYVLASCCCVLAAGCSVSPPRSQFPNVRAALDRMRATVACGVGVMATATIDRREGGSHREVVLIVSHPTQLRMDLLNSSGNSISTLTSDGTEFQLLDGLSGNFVYGNAKPCNLARLIGVAVPDHLFMDTLRGQTPVLAHKDEDANIEWDRTGFYVLTLRGTRDSAEEIHLVPYADDWNKPWTGQRLRVLEVIVRQQGFAIYHLVMSEHARRATAGPFVDPVNGVPIRPSGPQCDAELPTRIRIELPRDELQLHYHNVEWNPPLQPGLFRQVAPSTISMTPVDCQ